MFLVPISTMKQAVSGGGGEWPRSDPWSLRGVDDCALLAGRPVSQPLILRINKLPQTNSCQKRSISARCAAKVWRILQQEECVLCRIRLESRKPRKNTENSIIWVFCLRISCLPKPSAESENTNQLRLLNMILLLRLLLSRINARKTHGFEKKCDSMCSSRKITLSFRTIQLPIETWAQHE